MSRNLVLECMDELPELTVPIIDSLTNLSLAEYKMEEIRADVLDKLSSYDADAMPVVVRFVLQSVSPKAAQKDAKELQNQLKDQ